MEKYLLITGSYLTGAIPFGVIIARGLYQMNIREHGSKNTGATNVWRVLGWKPGLCTLLLDILKGAIPVMVAHRLFPNNSMVAILAGLAAIIGHNWSIFLMGSGGKGVATSCGVFLALIPAEGLIALMVFGVFLYATKHVSVGSIAGATALLVATLLMENAPAVRILVVVASLMTLIKHIPNMKRLSKGEEPKVNFK